MIWTLFKWEMYKLLHSKMTIIVIGLMVFLVILMGMPIGRLEKTKDMQNAMRTMDGKVIDNALIQEINESISSLGIESEANYKYTGIKYLLDIVNDNATKEQTADEFYESIEAAKKILMSENRLSKEEIAWWELDKNKVKIPFTYISSFNPRSLVEYMFNIMLLVILFAAARVSTIFASEHKFKTDSIILSTKYGRNQTFIAKVISSFVLVLCLAGFLTLALFLSIYLNSGMTGLNAIIQMEFPLAFYPITFLQLFLMQVVILFTASILVTSISMLLSMLFRSEIATTGLMFGAHIAISFIHIPNSFRLLSQFMAMLPQSLISIISVMDNRLINVFGNFFTMYSIAPYIYVALGLVLSLLTWVLYRCYKIANR